MEKKRYKHYIERKKVNWTMGEKEKKKRKRVQGETVE